MAASPFFLVKSLPNLTCTLFGIMTYCTKSFKKNYHFEEIDVTNVNM